MEYINPTPKRTSINYGINSIAIDPISIATCGTAHLTSTISPKYNNNIVNTGMGQTIDKLFAGTPTAHYDMHHSGTYNIVFDTLDCTLPIHINVAPKLNCIINIIANAATGNIIRHIYANISNHAVAQLNIVSLTAGYNILSVHTSIQDNATLTCNMIDLTNGSTIIRYYSDIHGNSATSNINSAYIGYNHAKIDLNYIVDVHGKQCNTNIAVQGVLDNNANKHLKGTINFVTGCTDSKGAETEDCLLLNDNAHSISLPMILCSEESVDGKHATSVGKIEPNTLFYLQSRGLTRKQATNLIAHTKLNTIISNIADADLVDKIYNHINKVI